MADTSATKTVADALRSDVVAYAAAVFLGLWLFAQRGWNKARDRLETAKDEHKAEIKALLEAERGRSVEQAKREFAIEHVAAGLLKLVEMGALVVRPGRVPKQQRDPMAADSPTLSLKLPGVRDDERGGGASGGGGET